MLINLFNKENPGQDSSFGAQSCTPSSNQTSEGNRSAARYRIRPVSCSGINPLDLSGVSQREREKTDLTYLRYKAGMIPGSKQL